MTGADQRAGPGRRRSVSSFALAEDCKDKLRELDLHRPVPSIEAFFQALGARLDRQMFLRPMDTSAGMCGLWVETIDYDVFFYERDTTPLHQALMLGHEAAHRIFGHHSAQVTREVVAGLLGLDVRLIKRVLARTTYTSDQERLAEVCGTLIAQRVVRPVVVGQQPMGPEDAEVLARLRAAFGGSGDAPAGS